MKHNEKAWIIGIFTFAILLRFLYAISHPIPTVMPDTYGYNLVGYKILHGDMPVINDERTPLYPLLLNIITRIAGRTDNRLDTPEFFLGSQYLAFLQSAISLLSFFFFYQTLRLIKIPLFLRLIVVTILSTNYYLLFNERTILTESLSVSLIIITTYFAIRLLLKPTVQNFTFCILQFTLLFLLRPVFFLYPLTLFPIIMIIHRKKQKIYTSIISLFVCLIFPFTFYVLNSINYSYFGINHITDVNILGRILKNNLSVESAKDNIFYGPVKKYREKGGYWDPYYFLFDFDPSLLTRDDNRKELHELQTFTKIVMVNQMPSYFIGGLKDIPKALLESPTPPPSLSMQYFQLWNLLYQCSRGVQIILILLFPLGMYSLIYKLIRHKLPTSNFQLQTALHCLLSSIYLLLTAIFFGYSDFGRLLLPLIPLLLIQSSLIVRYNQ